jgi:hypothetical protein
VQTPAAALIREAWHAGAADVLASPVTPDALNASLKHLEKRLMGREGDEAPFQARFRYLDETGRECWANISTLRFTLGRSSTNDLILTQMGISRLHAEVVYQDREYILRDLGSKLGTYLNGVKVEKSKLTNGDQVQLAGPHKA